MSQMLNQDEVRVFYNSVSNVWGENDPWHEYSKRVIDKYLHRFNCFTNSTILNAGSAGNSYNLDCKTMYHVDIAEDKIKNVKNSIVASIEKMPFQNDFFDNIICVGSVLNYCDALAAISELSRVLKANGNLFLEYESSWGFEYAGKDCYKNHACIITTQYIEDKHKQWLYSPFYINNIIKSSSLTIQNYYPFHICDGIFSKVLSDRTSVKLTQIDCVLYKMPFFRKHGNNIIMQCRKHSF